MEEKQNNRIAGFPVWVILLLILVLAGVLRVVEFGKAPPGLHQDEAVNAWNAYCLLKTGRDQLGVSWPVFNFRGVGGSWSPLYIYILIPFQMIGGLNLTTIRLPAVIFGVITIALIYYAGKRLFNEKVGLVSAFLMAVNPWHFQNCRWGQEGCISAFLGLAPLAAMLWANIIPDQNRRARPIAAGLAGLITGICCYGYQPVRLFLPVFLLIAVLLLLPQLRQSIKKPEYLFSVILFTVAFAVLFTPLAWQHISHPEVINRHFQFQSAHFSSVNLLESLEKTIIRYVKHFSPEYLFAPYDYLSPRNVGLLQWYMLLLLEAGIITVIIKFRTSTASRIVLALILAYPVGDCLAWGSWLLPMRCVAGLNGIILLAAMGAFYGIEWLRTQKKQAAWYVTGILAVMIVLSNIYYFRSFFQHARSSTFIYNEFHADIVDACKWLKPRLADYDAIIFTQSNMANMVAAVTLDYDPNKWLNEPRDINTIGEWDYYTRCGKMYFNCDKIYPSMTHFISAVLSRAQLDSKRILIIVRPGEVELDDPNDQILYKVIGPDGKENLWLCKI